MSWIATAGREALALFVDDGAFAVSILTWVAAIWLILSRGDTPPALAAVLLFAGLAGILVESVLRRARKAAGSA